MHFHVIHGFLGPRVESVPNGISIGSAILQGLYGQRPADRQATPDRDVCSNSPHLALCATMLANNNKLV